MSDLNQETALVQCKDLVCQANRAIVNDDDTLEKSITLKSLLVKFRNQAEKARKAEVDPLNKQVKEINAKWKNDVLNPIVKAESHLQSATLPYLEKKEAKEIEDRKKAQALLEEKALEIAEGTQGDAEAQARELRDLATEYEKQGDSDAANDLRGRAEQILIDANQQTEKDLKVTQIKTGGASKVASSYGGTGGITRTWTFEVEDKEAAIKALVAAGDFSLIQIDEVALGKLVRERKEVFDIPGIKVFQKKSLRAR